MTRGLDLLIAIATLGVLAGALVIMGGIDAGSRSQGGRFYIAMAAVVVLGVLLAQIGRFMDLRRRPWSDPTPAERRFAVMTLVVMIGSTVVLIGLAWLLP